MQVKLPLSVRIASYMIGCIFTGLILGMTVDLNPALLRATRPMKGTGRKARATIKKKAGQVMVFVKKTVRL